MSLFIKLPKPDRQQTQLAYRIKYWPLIDLSAAAIYLISMHKRFHIEKRVLLACCNEGKNTLTWRGRVYNVVWAYNNMPTEMEWDKVEESRFITMELRTSSAIAGYSVAILSFELPSDRLKAYKNGELS
jgi:hypothetical protein